jgi:hypothetical protein
MDGAMIAFTPHLSNKDAGGINIICRNQGDSANTDPTRVVVAIFGDL